MKIAESMKDTTRDIMASYNQRVKAVGGIVDGTRSTLNRFGRDRRKMSADQSKALTEFTGELSSTVGALMGKISHDHATMSKEQKAELAKGETERLKTFKGMMSDIQKGIKDIEADVASKLKEFTDAHADMSVELKKDLAKYVKDMVASVASMIGEYRADMKHTHAAWSSMAKTMAKARNKGILPTIETGGDVSSVEEAVEKKAKKKKEKEEEGAE